MRDIERPAIHERRMCVDCDNGFEITESEVAFYSSRDLKLPRRCADCRRARRLLRDEATTGNAY
jgi:hypothetical protein